MFSRAQAPAGHKDRTNGLLLTPGCQQLLLPRPNSQVPSRKAVVGGCWKGRTTFPPRLGHLLTQPSPSFGACPDFLAANPLEKTGTRQVPLNRWDNPMRNKEKAMFGSTYFCDLLAGMSFKTSRSTDSVAIWPSGTRPPTPPASARRKPRRGFPRAVVRATGWALDVEWMAQKIPNLYIYYH